MDEVTRILDEIRSGDDRAAERLLAAVYDELRRLAAARMRREGPGQTLQPTALVHEAWIRIAGTHGPRFENRAHFFGAAAEAMRRILVDRARRRNRLKRGGDRRRVELEGLDPAVGPPPIDLVALDEALARLSGEEPEKAELVKLRYFAGLTLPEAAEILGVSKGTADRWWAYARAWLFAEIRRGDTPNP